jgi:phosphoglycerol transferase MdoB-like AlkP superfamily enzyme
MNKIKAYRQSDPVSFFVCAAVLLFLTVSLALYLYFGIRNSEIIPWIPVSLCLAVICLLFTVFFPAFQSPLHLVSALLIALSLGFFLYQIYGTFVDLGNHVHFFGDTTQLNIMIPELVFLFIPVSADIFLCFRELSKKVS